MRTKEDGQIFYENFDNRLSYVVMVFLQTSHYELEPRKMVKQRTFSKASASVRRKLLASIKSFAYACLLNIWCKYNTKTKAKSFYNVTLTCNIALLTGSSATFICTCIYSNLTILPSNDVSQQQMIYFTFIKLHISNNLDQNTQSLLLFLHRHIFISSISLLMIPNTRFPQTTTKLRPPYLGILPGLRKPFFRQILLTLYVAVVVVANIKRV